MESDLRTAVLLVEDDGSIAKPLMKILELRGYKVDRARDGVEGLEYLKANPKPVCILLDIVMPRMNGWEFLAKVRTLDISYSKIPVIVLSADDDWERISEKAKVHFVPKPIDLKVLFSLFNEFGINERFQDQNLNDKQSYIQA